MARSDHSCPFCGGDDHCADVWAYEDETLDIEDRTPSDWGYGCACSAAIGPFKTEEEAVAAWDHRP